MGANLRLSDIAARAGVSEATVSRVLNNKAGVSPKTRRTVLDNVQEMERAVAVGTGIVGLVIPQLDIPVFAALTELIERALRAQGYTPVLCIRTPGGASEDDLVAMLVGRGAIGMVFISGTHADTSVVPRHYIDLTARGLPFVLVNGCNSRVEAPCLSVDDRSAMRMAVHHVVDLGHRRIGLVVGQHRYVRSQRKVEGFVSALRDLLGETPDGAERLVCHTLASVEGGQAAAGALLDQDCTAILCGSDLMALGAIRAVRQQGLSVPGQVSVVGFDDSSLMAFTEPPLTTIRQPVAAMANAAVAALLEQLKGGLAGHQEFVFGPELVVRGSTDRTASVLCRPAGPSRVG